jgi:predicted deacylase
MSALPSRLGLDIDLGRPGKQRGFIVLPHSVHRSAYGIIRMPIACIANGSGPTVLLTAGNHGDEFEGQVALLKLIAALEPAQVTGRIIVVPALNYPAALASSRTSPLDGVNLNRAFPGKRDGTPTEMLAHFIDSVLLPIADFGFDLHAGGSSLEYIPSTLSRWPADEGQRARLLAMHRVFGCPLALVAEAAVDDRTLPAAGLRHGGVHIACEIGGGGTLTPRSLAYAERGIRNFLIHVGALAGAPAPVDPPRLMAIGGADYHVYAPAAGLLEPCFALGDQVRAGQAAGFIHFLDEPDRPPRRVEFARDALVVCRRVPARVEPGDCIAQLATDRA